MILNIENVTFLSGPPGYWKQLITTQAISEREEGGMKHWNGSILDAYVPFSCPHTAESYNHRCSNESHSQSVTQTVCCSSVAAEILSSLRCFPCAWRALRVASAIIIRLTAWQDKVQGKTTLVQFICNEQCATRRCLEHKWCIAPDSTRVHGPRSQKQPWWKWRMDYTSVGAHCIRLLPLHRSAAIF